MPRIIKIALLLFFIHVPLVTAQLYQNIAFIQAAPGYLRTNEFVLAKQPLKATVLTARKISINMHRFSWARSAKSGKELFSRVINKRLNNKITLFFDSGSETIKEEEFKKLKQFAVLNQNATVTVLTYTCCSDKDRHKLSIRRAKKISEFLSKHGISVTGIKTRDDCSFIRHKGEIVVVAVNPEKRR